MIASRKGTGGSWNGASHCLKGGYTPLFAVNAEGEDFDGNRALIESGARPFDLALPIGSQLFGTAEGADDRGN